MHRLERGFFDIRFLVLRKKIRKKRRCRVVFHIPALNHSVDLSEKATMYSPLLQTNRVIVPKRIHSVNAHVIVGMRQHLKLKAYSASTIKTYLNEMNQLLQQLGDIPADELKPAHLKRYLVYCFEKLGLKENTLHSRINAMKFYYDKF